MAEDIEARVLLCEWLLSDRIKSQHDHEDLIHRTLDLLYKRAPDAQPSSPGPTHTEQESA